MLLTDKEVVASFNLKWYSETSLFVRYATEESGKDSDDECIR